MEQYPTEQLWDEISYLAYHMHWTLDSLLDLEHRDRIKMVESVADLNTRALDEARRLMDEYEG